MKIMKNVILRIAFLAVLSVSCTSCWMLYDDYYDDGYGYDSGYYDSGRGREVPPPRHHGGGDGGGYYQGGNQGGYSNQGGYGDQGGYSNQGGGYQNRRR
jgi:hypothetical protein